MRPLTELAKSRVRFHLGYSLAPDIVGSLELLQGVTLGLLKPEEQLTLLGPLTGDPFTFQGEILCSLGSELEKIEVSFQKLNPTLIDDSLFVSEAGSVKLRRDELGARRALYHQLQSHLATLVGIPLASEDSQGPSFRY